VHNKRNKKGIRKERGEDREEATAKEGEKRYKKQII